MNSCVSERLFFHLEAPVGWLNDPNGLCFFKGYYHVFFQYSPLDALGISPREWGHYVSRDLISWEFAGEAIIPDTRYDRNGAYSGTAVVSGEKMYIFYTGNVIHKGNHDYTTSGREQNVLCVSSDDGFSFSEKRLIMTNADFPDDMSCHVRDPKVWESEGGFNMLLGARTLDDKGCMLLYRCDSTQDLDRWHLVGRIETAEKFGYMWECPDRFVLDGREFLCCCPQGLPVEEKRFMNVHQAGYFALEKGIYSPDISRFYEWDAGFDFYAPQTFSLPDGRRLLIGWLGIGDSGYYNVIHGRQHCLTVPRELTCRSGKLYQQPIRELEALRKGCTEVSSGECRVNTPFELYADTSDSFEICLSDSMKMTYADKEFCLEFTNGGWGCGRTKRFVRLDVCGDIRILCDSTAVEIFLNGGEVALASRLYPDSRSHILKMDGVNGRLFELGRMEITL